MKRMKLKFRKRKGITLIDLLVSIMIFSVVMIGVALFNVRNTKAAIRSDRNAKRILLQEKAIEEFKGWLKSSPIPGARFDTIWAKRAVGDLLFTETDAAIGVTARLEIDSFIPDQSVGVGQTGIQLQLRVITLDPSLNINDTTKILTSRHD